MEKIITTLKTNACPFTMIKQFSGKPGIYAFFFTGSIFPLKGYNPQKDEIIYLGKTESSQASRDEKTHFASGKTGSSTVRKSLGALLKEELSLKPIPRNDNDYLEGRKAVFNFDEPSEEKLTIWMKNNLGLSFYEYDELPTEIDALETKLIAVAKPLLNIDYKNPDNPNAKIISAARKACADEANKEFIKMDLVHNGQKEASKTDDHNIMNASRNAHKYEDVFKKLLPQIEVAIAESTTREQSIQMDQNDFKNESERKSFSFNLEFIDGVVVKGIKGRAMARDLARVLEQNVRVYQKLKGKHLKFKLDKGFTLWISQ